MSRTGITYSEVAIAANTLVKRGVTPTVAAVREVLGTGSNSTILSLLKSWKEKKNISITETNEYLPKSLVKTVKELYESLKNNAEIEINKIQKESKEQVLHFKEEAERIQQLCSDHERKYDELQSNYKQVQEELSCTNQDFNKLQANLNNLNFQIAEKDKKINFLNELNKNSQDNLEHYRQSYLEQRRLDKAETDKRLHDLDKKCVELERINLDWVNENNKLNLKIEQLDNFIKEIQLNNSKIKEKHESLKELFAVNKIENNELRNIIQKIELENKMYQEKNLSLEKQESINNFSNKTNLRNLRNLSNNFDNLEESLFDLKKLLLSLYR